MARAWAPSSGNGFSLVKELPGTLVLDDPNTFGLASGSGSFLFPSTPAASSPATSKTAPIVVTTASTAGLTTGETVSVAGVCGYTDANGTWTITVLSNTTFSLNGSNGNANYTRAAAGTPPSRSASWFPRACWTSRTPRPWERPPTP